MLDTEAKAGAPGILVLFGLSVVAWAGFALIFRVFWPGSIAAGPGLFWIWLIIGSAAFVGILALIVRVFDIPPSARPAAAAALSAPALFLDVFTTTFFETWFPAASSVDDRTYAALVLGGVGVFLFAGLAMGRARTPG